MELVYLVIEKNVDDSSVITAHRTKQGANQSCKKLQIDWPNTYFWVDSLRIKD